MRWLGGVSTDLFGSRCCSRLEQVSSWWKVAADDLSCALARLPELALGGGEMLSRSTGGWTLWLERGRGWSPSAVRESLCGLVHSAEVGTPDRNRLKWLSVKFFCLLKVRKETVHLNLDTNIYGRWTQNPLKLPSSNSCCNIQQCEPSLTGNDSMWKEVWSWSQ